MPEEKSETKNPEERAEQQPLAGLRVLDLGNMLAASYCSRRFADFGAEVIKVELRRGDPVRGWRSHYNGMSLFWALLGRNKKTITLNLRHPVGQEIARKLAARCDIVVENFSPGTMERWGLGYEALSAGNETKIFLFSNNPAIM